MGKLLVDGPFIFAALGGRVDLRTHIPEITGGRTHLYVTRCVCAELKAGGDDLRGALLAARRFTCVNCDHVPGTSPLDCIKSLIGSQNNEKYMVGSHDPRLLALLRKTGVPPLVRVHLNVAALEPPTAAPVSQ